VLETAAGTGIVTRKLRDALPADTQLTATDLNPPMLDMARAKFRPGEQVGFQPADAIALPFADQSFDAIVCQFGVMFFPDKTQSFREARRVLAPDGVVAVWGYFELDGSTNVDVTTRALLPGNLVSPFTYEPVALDNGDPVATVQEFDTDYFDLVALDVAAIQNIAGDFSKLIISDGAGTTELKVAMGQKALRVFDGIPMGAITSTGSPGISLDVNTNLRATAFGSFLRVT